MTDKHYYTSIFVGLVVVDDDTDSELVTAAPKTTIIAELLARNIQNLGYHGYNAQ
jgi:hypothetical protein